MNAIALQRQLGYRLHQIGLAGALGLVLMLLAGVGWFTLVRGGESEIANAQYKLQALKQQVASKSALPVSSALDHAEQLRVFYASFAPAAKLPDTLKRIYRAAAKQELALESGEYVRLQGGGERLARFRVALPLKGNFKQVLGFMDAVLQENPSVALENASFKRDKVDDEAVEAKLVFLVFMDSQP